jgi:hypothetical protein
MMTKETTLKPRRTGGADAVRSLLQGGKGRKKKKGPGDRRKLLKRLNSAKEIKGNPRIFLAKIWPNFAG